MVNRKAKYEVSQGMYVWSSQSTSAFCFCFVLSTMFFGVVEPSLWQTLPSPVSTAAFSSLKLSPASTEKLIIRQLELVCHLGLSVYFRPHRSALFPASQTGDRHLWWGCAGWLRVEKEEEAERVPEPRAASVMSCMCKIREGLRGAAKQAAPSGAEQTDRSLPGLN